MKAKLRVTARHGMLRKTLSINTLRMTWRDDLSLKPSKKSALLSVCGQRRMVWGRCVPISDSQRGAICERMD
jgi:hypothetical protein